MCSKISFERHALPVAVYQSLRWMIVEKTWRSYVLRDFPDGQRARAACRPEIVRSAVDLCVLVYVTIWNMGKWIHIPPTIRGYRGRQPLAVNRGTACAPGQTPGYPAGVVRRYNS